MSTSNDATSRNVLEKQLHQQGKEGSTQEHKVKKYYR